MTFSIQGGNVQTRQVKLTTTAATVLVDGGQSGATVVAIYAGAINGTPSLTLDKWDGATSYAFRPAKAMATAEEYSREVLIVLKVGEQLRATSSVANAIDILATYIPGDRTAKGNGG